MSVLTRAPVAIAPRSCGNDVLTPRELAPSPLARHDRTSNEPQSAYVMAGALFPIVFANARDNRPHAEVDKERALIRSWAATAGNKVRQSYSRSARRRAPVSSCALQTVGRRSRPPSSFDRYGQQARSLLRRDPFASHAGHDVPTLCHKVLQYALDTAYAPIFSYMRPAETESLKLAWKQAAVWNPFLFHAEAVAGANWILLTTPKLNPGTARALQWLRLEQRQLALDRLASEIRAPGFVPTDAHIHAVVFLGCQCGSLYTCEEPYPLSPLGFLQNVYRFGMFEIGVPHVNAVYDMVKLRGGPESIKLHALREGLELYDLSIATRLDTMPRFPLQRPASDATRPDVADPLQDLAAQHHLPGCGLDQIKSICLELHCTMIRMSELTRKIEVGADGCVAVSIGKELTLSRNEIQHSLLTCLSRQKSVADMAAYAELLDQSPATIEVIRLVACIYSDMVLFPLPWTTGIKLRLAERLRLVWETSKMWRLSRGPQLTELCIWSLWFGSFAAFRSTHQDWFEIELELHLKVLYGDKWAAMTFAKVEKMLSAFLWWGPVCSEPGRQLWSRIRRSSGVKP